MLDNKVTKPDSASPAIPAPDASAQPTSEYLVCALPSCGVTFRPVKPWHKFHSDKCRREFHRAQGRPPMRGVISKVSILKRGEVSIMLRFGIDEQDRARQLTPGRTLEVVESE